MKIKKNISLVIAVFLALILAVLSCLNEIYNSPILDELIGSLGNSKLWKGPIL